MHKIKEEHFCRADKVTDRSKCDMMGSGRPAGRALSVRESVDLGQLFFWSKLALKIEMLEVNSMILCFLIFCGFTFVAKKVDAFSHLAFENRSLLVPFFWSKLTLKLRKLR